MCRLLQCLPRTHLPLPPTCPPQATLAQKESLLAEAMSSHDAQLELWRAEATEVAQAASKWKQRALLVQAQVVTREPGGGLGTILVHG